MNYIIFHKFSDLNKHSFLLVALFTLFKDVFLFICMCITCVLYLQRLEEGITILGFGNTGGYEPQSVDVEKQTQVLGRNSMCFEQMNHLFFL